MLIPHVQTMDELLDKAFSRASKKAKKKKVRGKPVEKAIQRERLRIDVSSSILINNLKKLVKETFSYEDLDPFYREMIGNLINIDRFKKSLSEVNWAYKKISEIKGTYIRKINGSNNPGHAKRVREQFYGRVSNILENIEDGLDYLNDCKSKLKKLPSIKDCPTVVLAGFPNVGKTYLLKTLTGSDPQIESYPFTTKNINVGSYKEKFQEFQVLDPPGLLDRPMEEMNNIERQSLTALKHLADLIIYVFDPSETAYPVDKQIELLEEIKKEFRDLKILKIVNKIDEAKKGKIEDIKNGASVDFMVSAKEEIKITIFKEKISEILKEFNKFD